MINLWRLLRRFPKYALVVTVLVVSTVLFFSWYRNHSKKEAPEIAETNTALVATPASPKTPGTSFDVAGGAERIDGPFLPERISGLFLAGTDLYNAVSGKLLAANWLKGAAPVRLFFEPRSRKLIGTFPNGMTRYALNGTVETGIAKKTPVIISDDSKTLVFAEAGDVWTAEIDLAGCKLENERRVTSLGQFMEGFFAQNVLLLTKKTLVLRNRNQLLRVNLEDGEVRPTQGDMKNIIKRRSPDGKSVVGVLSGQFFCYDLDKDKTATVTVDKRESMSDCQWLDGDRCAAILGHTVKVYDRRANTLEELATVPQGVIKIGELSPGGRFVLCSSWKQLLAVDLRAKTTFPIENQFQSMTWVTDETLLFSREIQDTTLRGTWIRKVNGEDIRISDEPYIVDRSGVPFLLVVKDASAVVFETKSGLWRVGFDGTGFTNLNRSMLQPIRLMAIESLP